MASADIIQEDVAVVKTVLEKKVTGGGARAYNNRGKVAEG
jgi:hypothetical protein